jgi:hypothetical protein
MSKIDSNSADINLGPHGNSAAAAIRRLRKDHCLQQF